MQSLLAFLSIVAQITLAAGSVREVPLQPGDMHDYTLRLPAGASAEVVVRQQGVDVVVELRDPSGALLDAIDGPTGRNGDERVAIVAKTGGLYRLRIKPFDAKEPAGEYTIVVETVRNAAATRRMMQERRAARDLATEWLRARSGTIDTIPLRSARVVALGEATHGSRELGDVRLALTRRLIEREGYRAIALEASADRIAVGEIVGWIGRRAQQELLAWIASWNTAHPNDRVRVIGVDAQDNAASRAVLGKFIRDAYGDAMTARWTAAEKELSAADEQTAVFGDSSVDPAVRQFLLELRANLALDAPILEARYCADAVRGAIKAATNLAQFADFNAGSRDGISHSRDWYMAANVLDAAASSRVVFWAHNAHVAAPEGGRTAGSLLRSALGCEYMPLAITFGEGAFVAQIPNDVDDRLAVVRLPAAPDETIESVLAPLGKNTVTAAWACPPDLTKVPTWLQSPHSMHWIGGLYAPDSLSSAAFRPFHLLRDFDGVIYVPRVKAEDIPPDRPRIAPRR